jgi:RNA polymerase sigma-70 factor, ECF subfamily
MAEALLREDSVEFNGERDTVREGDQALQRALKGDQEALGLLLASYMPQLYCAALRILGTPEDAEEALQDGLVQVVQHFREFEGRSRFSTWLTRIVINAALMKLRRTRREVMTSIDQTPARDDLSFAESITDTRLNPEEVYAREEQRQILKRQLTTLPDAYRLALWLRHVEGMSIREAAEALGIPVGSLKSRLHRARLMLSNEVGAVPGLAQNSLNDSARAGEPGTTRHRFAVNLTKEVVKPAA